MKFNLLHVLQHYHGKARQLHESHINPVFSQVLEMIGFQHEYTHGEGCYLTTLDGTRYFDALSGYGVFSMGRNHPVIVDAIHQALEANLPSLVQMDTFMLSGLLAEKLTATCPQNIQHAFFTNSGTEAVEGAIKFCRAATGRQRILYQPGAFHGLSTGSLSINGDDSFRESFGSLLPGATKVDLSNVEQVEAELLTESVAAVVMEPIRGKGVLFPTNENLYKEIQTLCRRTGTLLVCDEVQSGLGRTGKWWAFEHWGLEPDIITCAKALGGGLIPIGAILYTQDIYKKVFSRLDRCVVHSSTFGQNALAMVAGLAALQVLQDENLTQRAHQLGNLLLEGLKQLQQKHQFIYDVRGKGLMIGIEFGSPKSLILKPAWSLLHAAENGLFAQAVVMQLYKTHHILTQVAGHHQEVIKLIPPLIMTEDEVYMIINALDAVMMDCASFPGPVWSVGKHLAGTAAKQHLLKRTKQSA